MKKCILICDDDADILDVSRLILEKMNFTVITCSSYDAVFYKLDDIKPDIILLDVWMHGIGGEAATLKIKGDLKSKHIPVILFSANEDLENIAKKVKADDFIRKPFEIKELQRIIEKNLTP